MMIPGNIAKIEKKWWICGLLLLALMLNYMDRQVLSLTIVSIKKELSLTESDYGFLEKCFGYAFAFGGLLAGWLADRFSVRFLYPIILLGWSLSGVATGYADRIGEGLFSSLPTVMERLGFSGETPSERAFAGFVVCRICLGLFEAGQWPCALITTLGLLNPQERPFGNSLLQSGASLGAIVTPQVVNAVMADQAGSWRTPFVVVGIAGIFWIIPWLWLTRETLTGRIKKTDPAKETLDEILPLSQRIRQTFGLILVVVSINLTWHFFRAWLPQMLEEYHKYPAVTVRNFTSFYYIATDLGCISAGFLVKWLAGRGWPLHWTRVTTFALFTGLTSLSIVAAKMPPSLGLLVLLLVIGFGSLGLFPIYYSMTQEISPKNQGMLTGLFGFVTWIVIGEMQQLVGNKVKATGSYADGIFWAGLCPIIGLMAILILWGRPAKSVAQPLSPSK